MFANNHPFHENFFYHRPCPRGKLPSICTDINFSLLKYRKYQSFHALCFLCFWKASHSIRRQSSLYRRTESISRDYLVNRRRQSGYMKAVVRAVLVFQNFCHFVVAKNHSHDPTNSTISFKVPEISLGQKTGQSWISGSEYHGYQQFSTAAYNETEYSFPSFFVHMPVSRFFRNFVARYIFPLEFLSKSRFESRQILSQKLPFFARVYIVMSYAEQFALSTTPR